MNLMTWYVVYVFMTGLSILHWSTLNSQDRDIIRITLLASMVFFLVHFLAPLWHSFTSSIVSHPNSAKDEEQDNSTGHSTFRLFSCGLIGAIVDWYFLWHLTYRRLYGKKAEDRKTA